MAKYSQRNLAHFFFSFKKIEGKRRSREIKGDKSTRQSNNEADPKNLKKLGPLSTIYFQLSKPRSRTFAFLVPLIIIKVILLG